MTRVGSVGKKLLLDYCLHIKYICCRYSYMRRAVGLEPVCWGPISSELLNYLWLCGCVQHLIQFALLHIRYIAGCAQWLDIYIYKWRGAAIPL